MMPAITQNTITPSFGATSVNIFLSSSALYAPYLATTIASVVRQSSTQRLYDIIVLSKEICVDEQEKIASLASGKTNVTIRFYDVTKWTDFATKMTGGLYVRAHLAEATYYRLAAPSLLAQYERVIYIDSDIIMLADLAELFDVDLKGKAVGAVRAYPCIPYLRNPGGWWSSIVQMRDTRDYFCAGLMVMDLEKMRHMSYEEKLFKRISDMKMSHCLDQDALNHVLDGDVALLDPVWMGFGWQESLGRGLSNGDLPNDLWLEYRRSIDSPKAIHYLLAIKPWAYPSLPLADKFWECAATTPYYEQMLLSAQKNLTNELREIRNSMKLLLLPLSSFKFIFHSIMAKFSRYDIRAKHYKSVELAKRSLLLLNAGVGRTIPLKVEMFFRNILGQ